MEQFGSLLVGAIRGGGSFGKEGKETYDGGRSTFADSRGQESSKFFLSLFSSEPLNALTSDRVILPPVRQSAENSPFPPFRRAVGKSVRFLPHSRVPFPFAYFPYCQTRSISRRWNATLPLPLLALFRENAFEPPLRRRSLPSLKLAPPLRFRTAPTSDRASVRDFPDRDCSSVQVQSAQPSHRNC